MHHDVGAMGVEEVKDGPKNSTLLIMMKNRIKQVIQACFANEGEVVTEKGVILNEGCLAREGEQDEQKKMQLQLEKIDAMLRIPYENEDGRIVGQTAGVKLKVKGIS